MINIITQKIKEQHRSVAYYFLGLFVYAWMIVGLFPTIQNSGLSEIYSKYPEDLMKFFGASDMMAMSKIEGFISFEFLSLFFVLIIAFYLGSAAGSTIAGAIERKTMDFQLSQPISRTKLVLSETIVGLFNAFLLTALTALSIFLLAKAYYVSISGQGLLAFCAVATFFLWAFYGIALFLSAILKSKITVASGTVAIVMLLYVFTSMTKLVEKLENFDKYSLFYLYDPQKILESGNIDWNHIIMLALILVVGVFSSIAIFNKKDI